VYGYNYRDEYYSLEEKKHAYYKMKKCYSRAVHLARIIKKINCTSKSKKDNLDMNLIIKKYKLNKNDSINIVRKKIKDHKINHYIIMQYYNPNYIFINYELQHNIFKIYNQITKIFYDNLSKIYNRKNFLNNFYVLKKILIMLHYNNLADRIQDLKIKKNIEKYNIIWNDIIKYYKHK